MYCLRQRHSSAAEMATGGSISAMAVRRALEQMGAWVGDVVLLLGVQATARSAASLAAQAGRMKDRGSFRRGQGILKQVSGMAPDMHMRGPL
jgi:hypothetical protein